MNLYVQRPGTLARLDRDAPVYGNGRYNDFNTARDCSAHRCALAIFFLSSHTNKLAPLQFYLQASSGTKGGSSGSPVVDCRGLVVGLNAGGANTSSTAFYLPLHRVARALALIRASASSPAPLSGWRPAPSVPRGCLLATFGFKAFDEARRLGLSSAAEHACRTSAATSPYPQSATGLLVVESVVPNGPASAAGLAPGDLLLRINGELAPSFQPMSAALDDSVGGVVEIDIERAGVPMKLSVSVADLHAVTPAKLLRAWGGVLHAVSYQQARAYLGGYLGLFVCFFLHLSFESLCAGALLRRPHRRLLRRRPGPRARMRRCVVQFII